MGIALKPPAHMRARAAVLCSCRGIACMHEIHVYRGCMCFRQGGGHAYGQFDVKICSLGQP